MYILKLKNMTVSLDRSKGHIASLTVNGKERIAETTPIFRIRLRDEKGNATILSAYDAKKKTPTADGAIYTDFPSIDVSVRIHLSDENGEAAWRIEVTPNTSEYFVEWTDFPLVTLPNLEDNNSDGNGGKLLFPYNEGALISDATCREETALRYADPEYPSMGCYAIFPNMICSQMIAYLWKDSGLYLGAHDAKRSVKGIDFLQADKGITLRFRLFCGVNPGEAFKTEYPIIWAVTEGRWESAADRYREWFESSLPPKVKKIKENPAIPEWYEDSPLVVSYCVRGKFDTDEMKPNKLYPYTNALPVLDELRTITDSRLLVLLMHWEGTAPWAPPYVWEPFGGTENFNAFLDTLHKKGDLLGVYCSGFGYTIQSNLISDYNRQAEYDAKGLSRGMCAGPDGKVAISLICQNQRSGYDICPASEVGRAILDEAYAPLFESGLDYVQILDQNHGGGQYFCYSREHGHPAGPGVWMTESMQNMLSEWNDRAPKMLFGCESAAAEAFIGNLLFSDNRFELNYKLGVAVPMYAYIYHEYVRNFMGNQVSCPFRMNEDTLRYRIAYAFAAGDCMTLVLTQDGDFVSHWGMKDFSVLPDKEKAIQMIANLTRFYKEQAKPYLYAGRMITAPEVKCDGITFGRRDSERNITLPTIFSSAWQAEDGSRAMILVNPTEKDIDCFVDGKPVTVPKIDAVLLKI